MLQQMLDPIISRVTLDAWFYAPVLIGLAAAYLVGRAVWSLIPVSAPVAAIDRVTGAAREETPAQSVFRPMLPLAHLVPASRKSAANLRLVQAMGRLQGIHQEEIAAMQLGGALVGFIFVPVSVLVAVPLIAAGFIFPANWLAAQADHIRQDIFRELPDVAESFAFLVGLGLPVDEALRRMAAGDTPFSRLLRRGIVNVPPGQALTEHLADWVEDFQITALSQLFHRLADISRRGVGEQALLGDLAAATATGYEAELITRAEQLESKFTPVLGVFFFLPYLAIMVLPVVYGFVASGIFSMM